MAVPSFNEIVVSLDRYFGFSVYFTDADGVPVIKSSTYTVRFYDKNRNFLFERTSAQNGVIIQGSGTRLLVNIQGTFLPSTGATAIPRGIGCMEIIDTGFGDQVECSLPVNFLDPGTPIGNGFGSITMQNARSLTVSGFWTPDRGTRIIKQTGVAQTLTNTTTETVIDTVLIPAGTMGPNDSLEILALWSWPNNANSKTVRAKLGATIYQQIATTATVAGRIWQTITNRGVVNSQIGHAAALTGLGATAVANVTSAINFSLDQTVFFTGLLGVATDTITLESYIIKVHKG